MNYNHFTNVNIDVYRIRAIKNLFFKIISKKNARYDKGKLNVYNGKAARKYVIN